MIRIKRVMEKVMRRPWEVIFYTRSSNFSHAKLKVKTLQNVRWELGATHKPGCEQAPHGCPVFLLDRFLTRFNEAAHSEEERLEDTPLVTAPDRLWLSFPP